ncbi:hypothetical protein EDD17DRAFT_1750456 [Pisolithus thermaeus]|nr:hypothetical protein EDD17DRAFT_1750456 [Pisolithus thermaeus]
MNHLVSLKDKYCEHVKSLNQMGVGVAPGASNLCVLAEMIISVFPHFEDLNSIWRGNPSFDAQPFTSNQQMNCSEDMLSLVGEPAALQDNSATSDQGIGGTPWGEYDHGGTGDYDYSGMGEDDGQVGEHAGDYNFQDQAGGTSYRRDDDFGRMSYRRDDNIRGTFDDVEMYEGTENDTDAASAGIQTWQETVPSGMQIRATPQTKHCTKSWDSHDTSKFMETLYHWGTHASTSGSAPPSTSQPHHCFTSPYS